MKLPLLLASLTSAAAFTSTQSGASSTALRESQVRLYQKHFFFGGLDERDVRKHGMFSDYFCFFFLFPYLRLTLRPLLET